MSEDTHGEMAMTVNGAEYSVRVFTDSEGTDVIKFKTTNPPRGLDSVLYEFYGKLPREPRP